MLKKRRRGRLVQSGGSKINDQVYTRAPKKRRRGGGWKINDLGPVRITKLIIVEQ